MEVEEQSALLVLRKFISGYTLTPENYQPLPVFHLENYERNCHNARFTNFRNALKGPIERNLFVVRFGMEAAPCVPLPGDCEPLPVFHLEH